MIGEDNNCSLVGNRGEVLQGLHEEVDFVERENWWQNECAGWRAR